MYIIQCRTIYRDILMKLLIWNSNNKLLKMKLVLRKVKKEYCKCIL